MKVILFLLFTLPLSAQAFENQSKAISMSGKALMSYPSIKEAKESLEHKFIKKTDMNKEAAAVIGSSIVSASSGKIETKHIKKLETEAPLGGRLRPDVMYDFSDKEMNYTLKLRWEF